MTTSSGRKHAGPGRASDQLPVPEPAFAERARTLVYLGRIGSLSTLSGNIRRGRIHLDILRDSPSAEHKKEHNNCRMRGPESYSEVSVPTVSL
jgi:hypothetical protein